MHEIKQAVNYMGPELLLRNAPPPPASNFVHFFHYERILELQLSQMVTPLDGANLTLPY